MKMINQFYPLLMATSILGGLGLYHNFFQNFNLPPAYAQEQQTSVEKYLIVIAYLQVKPEYRQKFLNLANRVQMMTNETEPGVNHYTFYEDKNNPNTFFFFEEWKNQQAFEEHLQKDYTKNLTKVYPEILAKPADVRIYRIQDVEQKQLP